VALRFDDSARTVALSVRDLAEGASPAGHLLAAVAQSRRARLALGRQLHEAWQSAQQQRDAAYRPEVSVEHRLQVGAWTVSVLGRLDGLQEEDGHTIVEEIKSTALDASRLLRTQLSDWPAHTTQLELYLWLLHQLGYPAPQGRLVLISVLDGSRHILGLAPELDRLHQWVLRRLTEITEARERRLAWYARRRNLTVPTPFTPWRAGQQEISEQVTEALGTGARLLVEAPTGLGKTAAVLHGALSHALAHDRQLFWATSRNTQQAGVMQTLARFTERGLPLTAVALRAKEQVCLNEVVACRPDLCAHARDYYDKLAATDLIARVLDEGGLSAERAMELGRAHVVCPFELALDVSEHVDVVVGDVNYALSPHGQLKRHFGEQQAASWVVVVDEAHQLVDRAREHHSPRVDAARVRSTYDRLQASGDPALAPFLDLCREALDALLDLVDRAPGPFHDGLALAELNLGPWRRIAERVDELALDYALLRAHSPDAAQPDPWHELAWDLLRFAAALEEAGEETVALVQVRTGQEQVRLLCLDPSRHLAPRVERLGGLIGCSATLSPPEFYRDLLGLPADSRFLTVPSPFPPERHAVLIAPRVSTMWRDREADGPATAALLQSLIEATPGNVALYFSSFAMLQDLTDRLDLTTRTWLVQQPGMSTETRQAWLDRLSHGDTPVVLAAVLGGIFAEGIDLPPGALHAVVIVGPALPPIGLERDLLRAYYDEHFGAGFLYASLIPGMTRVVQAAGRLIRRPDDRGVVVLVGRRFRWRDHLALLPARWSPTVPDDPAAAVRAFWGEHQ
jgi:DNA excision repair protein ERCC-2